MRNWNYVLFTYIVYMDCIASLPMRNWNNKLFQKADKDSCHCEPTYEELKLKKLILEKIEEKRIASLPMRNWNERRAGNVGNVIGIASLPMRNWNKFLFQLFKYQLLIASLPMRNWNKGVLLRLDFSTTIASLPMRNWNPTPSYHLMGWHKHCEPTYEELKLFYLPW